MGRNLKIFTLKLNNNLIIYFKLILLRGRLPGYKQNLVVFVLFTVLLYKIYTKIVILTCDSISLTHRHNKSLIVTRFIMASSTSYFN